MDVKCANLRDLINLESVVRPSSSIIMLLFGSVGQRLSAVPIWTFVSMITTETLLARLYTITIT